MAKKPSKASDFACHHIIVAKGKKAPKGSKPAMGHAAKPKGKAGKGRGKRR